MFTGCASRALGPVTPGFYVHGVRIRGRVRRPGEDAAATGRKTPVNTKHSKSATLCFKGLPMGVAKAYGGRLSTSDGGPMQPNEFYFANLRGARKDIDRTDGRPPKF